MDSWGFLGYTMSMETDHSLIIQAGQGGLWGSLVECWKGRELLSVLGWREVKVRYRQTLLGVAWAGLQPLVTMAVFFLVFHRMAGIDSGKIPYPLFAFAGLLPWLLFQTVLERSSVSLVQDTGLVTKVYFPRLLVPLSRTASGLVDFAVSLVLFGLLMIFYRTPLTWSIFLLPVFSLWALLASVSVAVWLSALNARYRDIAYVVPFLLRIWLFLSPVGYSIQDMSQRLPKAVALLFHLNPMTGVIEGFRWALLGEAMDLSLASWLSILVMSAILITGLFYFRKTERVLADVL